MRMRHSVDRSCSNVRGLSIVELIVVAAVAGILAATVLPMLLRSRDTSLRARCAANLGQFSAAFYLYAQDWNGWWPSPGGLAGDWNYWAQTGSGGLEGYLRQRGVRSVWCCPRLTEWHSKYPARSYSMNSYLRTPSDIEYPSCVGIVRGINVGWISKARATVLLYEGVELTTGWENTSLYNYIYRCANWAYVRGYTDNVVHTKDPGKPGHGPLNNYLYCDGHIAARMPGRRTVAQLSTYREMSQWYVDKTHFEDVYQRHWSRLVPRD